MLLMEANTQEITSDAAIELKQNRMQKGLVGKMTLQKGNWALFIKQDSWPLREGGLSLSFSTMAKSRLMSNQSIISKVFRLICYCEMKFLQTIQEVNSSFRTAPCTCQIWSYKSKLFWVYLSTKKNGTSEQFSEKETVHQFPEKK